MEIRGVLKRTSNHSKARDDSTDRALDYRSGRSKVAGSATMQTGKRMGTLLSVPLLSMVALGLT